MTKSAVQRLKIDFLSSHNTVDGVTKQIIIKWLNRDNIRNACIREASIVIFHRNFNSMFFQSSNTEWSDIYIGSGAYDKGNDLTLSNIFFDKNDQLVEHMTITPWALADIRQAISMRIEYINNKYDNYKNLGGVYISYFDPIRDNRVYFSFVIDMTQVGISRQMISSLYKSMKELYLELLPYAVCALMDRNFKNVATYKNILSKNLKEQNKLFTNLKSSIVDSNCKAYFI